MVVEWVVKIIYRKIINFKNVSISNKYSVKIIIA